MTRSLDIPSGEAGGAFLGADGCLSPDTAAGFVQGWLAGDELSRAEGHIDRCDECRRHISELVRVSGQSAPAGSPLELEGTASPSGGGAAQAEGGLEAPLPRGGALGRYLIDGLLGAGAMGVVYAAFDPKLDRKIALKLLRRVSAEGPEAEARLLREARAMARLMHPNVVAVHDVGVHGGRPFLAMEYVDGVTLRTWLRSESRTLRDVLRACLQAGRGLAAAHAAGVVHRDFKPDNVLVDGRGRVCVTDFGLARAALSAPAQAPPGGGGVAAPGPNASHTGTLAGTPAYMAPEQFRGEAADASSDQFSFCVVLYEALYAQRPFEGSTLRGLAEAVAGGRVREPPGRADVPARVRKAVLRGLSVEPDERFASMGDLLEALTDEPGARRRRLAAAVGAASLTIAASSLAYRHARNEARPTCQGAEQKLEGVWGEGRKNAVREAFLSTGKPFAADAWRAVERTLDGYARDWAASRVDACEATHVRGEQSAELLDRRMACLDDRLKEMGALAEVFSRADAGVVAKAAGAAHSLTPLAPCADAKALRGVAKPPPDAATAAKTDELWQTLIRAQALGEVGKYQEALPLATGVALASEALGNRVMQGEALLRSGQYQGLVGDAKGAEATHWRAIAVADAAGDDAVRAQAYVSLIFNLGTVQAKGELVPQLNEQAHAAIARLGGRPGLEGLLRSNFATTLRRQGKYDEAQREYEAALPLLEAGYGPNSRQTLVALNGLGNAHLSRRDLDAAGNAFRRYIELVEGAFGPHHPNVGHALNGLGTVLMSQLRFAEAAGLFERGLAIAQEASGAESPTLTPYLNNLATMFCEQGRYEDAASYSRRSLSLAEKHLGPEHPDLIFSLAALGEAYLGLGDRRRAAAHLERALQRRETAETAAERAQARFALARALTEPKHGRGRARALALEARDAYRAFSHSPLDVRNLRLIEQWLEQHPGG